MNELINAEKHYVTLNNYLQAIYHQKVYRIALNAGFSCPNRDGKVGYGGCIYCSEQLSGDFSGDKELPFSEQFQTIQKVMAHKWGDGYYIAYLQAGSNTYGSIEKLRKDYYEIIKLDPKIKILSIATRPDCLNADVIELLQEISKEITVWVELGFQTMHTTTWKYINRGYPNEVFEKAVKDLKAIGITVVVHIINGLPNETAEMMIQTVKWLNQHPIDGIKIHMLHVMENTPLGHIYNNNPFPLLSLTEYVEIVGTQLRNLSTNIVIHRLSGDAPIDKLIAPKWTIKKLVVMNEIDKYMRKHNYYQGDLCTK